MFIRGYKCPECGPIEKASKKTIKKVQHEVCPGCGSFVTKWERPLKERPGRCQKCGNAGFELKIKYHQLLRRCKGCNTVFNTDTERIMEDGAND